MFGFELTVPRTPSEHNSSTMNHIVVSDTIRTMSDTGPGGQTGPVTFRLDKRMEQKQACF